jgi:hypothetical protein
MHSHEWHLCHSEKIATVTHGFGWLSVARLIIGQSHEPPSAIHGHDEALKVSQHNRIALQVYQNPLLNQLVPI